MTRLEKCKLAVEKGYTYDPLSGNVTGPSGKIITRKTSEGYIHISICENKKYYNLRIHQFAWYVIYGEVVDCIDHIERVNSNFCNNSISNLRSVTSQQNKFNNNVCKGFGWHKVSGKYRSYIKLNKKQIHLGTYDTKEEAHQAYLDAKKIYHIIP